MNNYRNNMPHYDSMPHHYNPMGINDFKTSNNNRMKLTNTMPIMPGMPENIFQTPFIPETEMPLEIDGDMPALPRMPETQMPGVIQPEMPRMPQQGMPGIPGLIPPWMPQMPGMQQPQMPMMPGMPQPQMPMMPGMPQPQMPMMPGMPQTGMPRMPEMPQNGMPPDDGNMYPMMPGMPNGIPPVTCKQLRELMRRMNCPINDSGEVNNGPGPTVPPENETVPPVNEDM